MKFASDRPLAGKIGPRDKQAIGAFVEKRKSLSRGTEARSSGRPVSLNEAIRANDYVKATSLKSIETISMSVMGLRSGPRA